MQLRTTATMLAIAGLALTPSAAGAKHHQPCGKHKARHTNCGKHMAKGHHKP